MPWKLKIKQSLYTISKYFLMCSLVVIYSNLIQKCICKTHLISGNSLIRQSEAKQYEERNFKKSNKQIEWCISMSRTRIRNI